MCGCKWCGSDRHPSDQCPTLNFVNSLLGRDHDQDNMPDIVGVIDDLLAMDENELHDNGAQLNKLKPNKSKEAA